MIRVPDDILSLSDFKRRSAELLRRLKRTRQPLVLTVNGKAEIVVQDAASYQRMQDLLERAAAIAGIAEGLEQMKAGEGQDLDSFDGEMRRKFKIPTEEK